MANTYRQHWEGNTLVYTPSDPALEGWALRRKLIDPSGKYPYYQVTKDNKPVGHMECGLKTAKQALEGHAAKAEADAG